MKAFTASCGVLILSFAVVTSRAQSPTGLDYDSTIQQGTAQLQAGHSDQALAFAENANRLAPGRWEGHALLGRSLLGLKRYEPAADALSKAIELAPPSEQPTLRDLRRQSLLAEASEAGSTVAVGPAPAPTLAERRMSVETARRIVSAHESEWFDASSGLDWARPWYYPPHGPRQSDFVDAQGFCSSLRLADHVDWRLPTADELQHVFLTSSPGWHNAKPHFVEGYGLNKAMSDGKWDPEVFTVNGVKYQGNRLFVWTSTPGERAGEHLGLYFGEAHSLSDTMKSGQSQWGRMDNPFQGYALCVRAEAP